MDRHRLRHLARRRDHRRHLRHLTRPGRLDPHQLGRLAGHPGDQKKNLAYHGEVIKNCPEVRETLIIDDGAIAELARRGAAVTDADLDARHAGSNAADAATLIYTSGTTGRPRASS